LAWAVGCGSRACRALAWAVGVALPTSLACVQPGLIERSALVPPSCGAAQPVFGEASPGSINRRRVDWIWLLPFTAPCTVMDPGHDGSRPFFNQSGDSGSQWPLLRVLACSPLLSRTLPCPCSHASLALSLAGFASARTSPPPYRCCFSVTLASRELCRTPSACSSVMGA